MNNVLKSIALALLALLVVVLAAVLTFARNNTALINSRAALPTERNAERDGQSAQPDEQSDELPSDDGLEVAAAKPDEELSGEKVGWGPGTQVNGKNQTVGSLDAQSKYGALGGYFIFPDDDKVIYLTFDLGYENGYTPSIIDTLDERGVKATFFLTGDYLNEAPDVVRRLADGGHTLGNHTIKHPSLPEISVDRVQEEVMGLHERVKSEFGYEMKLFRYPRGEFSERSLRQLTKLGYNSIFWSFAYKDWLTDAQPEPAAALERLCGALHPGAIYLLHAVSSTNDAIMGDFIDYAQAQGYRFALIDERLGLVEKPAALESVI